MERADEQIKQIYDIALLLTFNWEKIDLSRVEKAFKDRAESEARRRSLTVNIKDIFSDMMTQMKQLSVMDLENNKSLLKRINDFQSLYVRKELNRSPGEWAAIGAKIHFLLGCLSLNKDAKSPLNSLFQCEQNIRFDHLQGVEKGQLVRRFREEFSKDFEKYNEHPAKILKGKSPARILWAVASPDNVDELTDWIKSFTRQT